LGQEGLCNSFVNTLLNIDFESYDFEADYKARKYISSNKDNTYIIVNVAEEDEHANNASNNINNINKKTMNIVSSVIIRKKNNKFIIDNLYVSKYYKNHDLI